VTALSSAIIGARFDVPNQCYAELGEEIALHKKLGGGMFGAVCQGTWNGQQVAIKLVYNPEELGAFIREVELLKTLQHANIVEFYHFCLLPYPTLVMELVTGGDLLTVIQRKQIDCYTLLVRIALDIARGLNYMHQQQPPVLHRYEQTAVVDDC
jgi:serine/threonine protein kinase